MSIAHQLRIYGLIFLIAPIIMNAGDDKQNERPAREVISRELAFAARAQVINPRDAFLEFFAPDSVMFAPEPVSALKRLIASPPWNIQLRWWPVAVAISADGKLAYSTGPVRSRPKGQSSAADTFGSYFSIWKKNEADIWEVIADLGTDTPQCFARPDDAVQIHFPRSKNRSGNRQTLADADRRFASGAGQDLISALKAVAAPRYRLYLPDVMPVIGADNALTQLQGTAKWTCTGSSVAASDDFGACWGRGQGGYLDGEFGFLRVWQRNESDQWEILAEVLNGHKKR